MTSRPKTNKYWLWRMTSLGVMNGYSQTKWQYRLKRLSIKYIELEPGLLVEVKHLFKFIEHNGYRKHQ